MYSRRSLCGLSRSCSTPELLIGFFVLSPGHVTVANGNVECRSLCRWLCKIELHVPMLVGAELRRLDNVSLIVVQVVMLERRLDGQFVPLSIPTPVYFIGLKPEIAQLDGLPCLGRRSAIEAAHDVHALFPVVVILLNHQPNPCHCRPEYGACIV